MNGRDLADWIVLIDMTFVLALFAATGTRAVARSLDFHGKHPVSGPVFALGKLSMLACWSALSARAAGVDIPSMEAPPWTAWAGAVAAALVAASFVSLGDANRFGLPKGDVDTTRLRTSGVYGISRNPMYVSFGLICLAACLYVPHPVTIALTLAAAAVHHAIVLAEERYLEERFGGEWREYRSRVRRYL